MVNDSLGKIMGHLQRLAEAQEQLKTKIVQGKAGDEAVVVTINGQLEVQQITIDPALIQPEQRETLQAYLVAAVNDALHQSQLLSKTEMAKVAKEMNLPDFPGIF